MQATQSRKKMLPRRTQADLRAAVYHITYEREALFRAVKHFRRTEGRFPLEAALVHARNLIDFFWTPTTSGRLIAMASTPRTSTGQQGLGRGSWPTAPSGPASYMMPSARKSLISPSCGAAGTSW